MTWSYSGNPATSTKDAVRWYVGDTDTTQQQLQDEEIEFAISLRVTAYGSTAMCAQALAGKYSRLVNASVDGMSTQLGARATMYATLAREYEEKNARINAGPYVGGISISDMRTILSNPDRVPDLFRIGMFDNPPGDGVVDDQMPGGDGEAFNNDPYDPYE